MTLCKHRSHWAAQVQNTDRGGDFTKHIKLSYPPSQAPYRAEGAKDGSEQLRHAIKPAARPGHVSREACGESDRRVKMAARNVGSRVNCAHELYALTK